MEMRWVSLAIFGSHDSLQMRRYGANKVYLCYPFNPTYKNCSNDAERYCDTGTTCDVRTNSANYSRYECLSGGKYRVSYYVPSCPTAEDCANNGNCACDESQYTQGATQVGDPYLITDCGGYGCRGSGQSESSVICNSPGAED